MSKRLKIRTLDKPLEAAIPPVVRLLLQHYMTEAKEFNRCQLSFVVDGLLPLSLNHQTKRILLRLKGGMTRASEALKPEVHHFRKRTELSIGTRKVQAWKPTGVTAAVVLFESPVWVTQELKVRKEDADNKLKPALDAAARATGVPDELHWHVHAFKVPSKKTRTIVYLFDLGDQVDYYG